MKRLHVMVALLATATMAFAADTVWINTNSGLSLGVASGAETTISYNSDYSQVLVSSAGTVVGTVATAQLKDITTSAIEINEPIVIAGGENCQLEGFSVNMTAMNYTVVDSEGEELLSFRHSPIFKDVQSQDTIAWTESEYFFHVIISNVGEIDCEEVQGLELEYDTIEYRAGDIQGITKLKMPGLRRSGDITLKRGRFDDDRAIWEWINMVMLNTLQRETVIISLLDENRMPVVTWEVLQAWPKKVTVEGFKVDQNAVNFETLVLAHEGVNTK